MKTNPILQAWIDGCTQIRKIHGGYDFIWVRADGSKFHKILHAGKVTSRLHGVDGRLVNETTMPIEIGMMDIIKASVAIKASGKVVK